MAARSTVAQSRDVVAEVTDKIIALLEQGNTLPVELHRNLTRELHRILTHPG